MKNKELHIIAFGDVLLEESFLKSKEYDDFINIFNTADLVTFNLETTVSSLTGTIQEKSYNFKSHPDFLGKLNNDIKSEMVCNIANNHIMDYGQECFVDTIENLEKHNIDYTGVSKVKSVEEGITFKKMGDFKIAFIGAFQGYNVTDETLGLTNIDNELYDKVRFAKEKVDYVIVHLHWGEELSLSPSPDQKQFAHSLIDCGVDLIIGHHPHVIQGIEKYKEKHIVYSLGNFQMITGNHLGSKYSHIISLVIDQEMKIIKDYTLYPIFICDKNPQLITDEENSKQYNKILGIANHYVNHTKWITFYSEVCDDYFVDNFKAWRMRRKKSGLVVYLKMFRWFLRRKTLCMGFFYVINKIFRVKGNIHEKY